MLVDHSMDNKLFVTQTGKVQAKEKQDTLVLDEITILSLKVQAKLRHSDRGHRSY